MAGAKETPRQKLISLMYLVFITMLALNVSKEVLDGFGQMFEKITDANERVLESNNLLLENIVVNAEEKGGKWIGHKRTAEQIKIEVGAAIDSLENPPQVYAVRGRDLMTGIPKEIYVSFKEIAHALDKSISKIEEAILSALEMTPPELSADIYKTGIYLAGGGTMLRGLDKRISKKTKLPVHIAEDPLRAVARGTGIALKNIDKFQFLIKG